MLRSFESSVLLESSKAFRDSANANVDAERRFPSDILEGFRGVLAVDRDISGRALSGSTKFGNTETRKQGQEWEVRFDPSFKEPSATSLRINA